MHIINSFADNQLTDLIFHHFGANLETLNIDEQLYLLQACVCYIGDAEEEMHSDAIEAAKQIEKTTEIPVEAMALVLGLGELLDERVNKFLSDYVNNWWSEAAMEAFGNSLDRMTINERAWNLYSLLQEIVDHNELVNREKIESVDEWILNACEYGFAQHELIRVARAIAHIAAETYYSNNQAA
ncbi:MAG: hypothetical protein AAFX80_09220 [Cyanobacteria bacterium J06639_18]